MSDLPRNQRCISPAGTSWNVKCRYAQRVYRSITIPFARRVCPANSKTLRARLHVKIAESVPTTQNTLPRPRQTVSHARRARLLAVRARQIVKHVIMDIFSHSANKAHVAHAQSSPLRKTGRPNPSKTVCVGVGMRKIHPSRCQPRTVWSCIHRQNSTRSVCPNCWTVNRARAWRACPEVTARCRRFCESLVACARKTHTQTPSQRSRSRRARHAQIIRMHHRGARTCHNAYAGQVLGFDRRAQMFHVFRVAKAHSRTRLKIYLALLALWEATARTRGSPRAPIVRRKD